MFAQVRLVPVPAVLEPKLNIGYKFVFGGLGTMIAGMVFAAIYQWTFGVVSKTLMDSPLILQIMMIGGFVAFLVALVVSLIGFPIWYRIRHGSDPATDGTTHSQCRIAWKSLRTGFQSHGDWHELHQEAGLKAIADDADKRYAGVLKHWIEYR